MECHDGGSGVSGPGKRKKVAGATNPFGGMGHILSEWLGKDGRPRTERWGNRVRVLRRGIKPGKGGGSALQRNPDPEANGGPAK